MDLQCYVPPSLRCEIVSPLLRMMPLVVSFEQRESISNSDDSRMSSLFRLQAAKRELHPPTSRVKSRCKALKISK